MEHFVSGLNIRLTKSDHANFKKKCKEFPVKYADMIREMIIAFTEDRLTISIPSTQKSILKGVHNVN